MPRQLVDCMALRLAAFLQECKPIAFLIHLKYQRTSFQGADLLEMVALCGLLL